MWSNSHWDYVYSHEHSHQATVSTQTSVCSAIKAQKTNVKNNCREKDDRKTL